MSDTVQNVTVRLKIAIDPDAPRAFQQLARAANKANKDVAKENKQQAAELSEGFKSAIDAGYRRAGIAGQLGFGRFGQSVAGNTNFAAGLGKMGFEGAGAIAGKAAIPLAIASQVVEGSQKVAGYAYDRYSTNSQIGRQVVRDLIPGGEKVQNYIDAISGRAAGYEQADINSQYRQAEINARNQRTQFQLQFNPQQAGRETFASAIRSQGAITPSVFDRSTALGERSRAEEQRQLPLRQAQAKAERELAQATSERAASEQELAKIQGRSNDLVRQRTALNKQLLDSDNQSGVSRQDLLKRIGDVNLEIGNTAAQTQGAANQVAQSRAREVVAGGESRKAFNRNNLLGQADLLESRAEDSSAAAGRLGGQSPFDRAFGLQAARLIQERGSVEGLPDEYIQAGAAFAPKTIAKIVEKTGLNAPEFQAGVKEFAADFGDGDPSGNKKRADELRQQAAGIEHAIEQDIAGGTANAFRDLGRTVIDAINTGLAKTKAEILNAVLVGRNSA